MKNLIIDRFESGFAICEDENGEFFGIDIKEVPQSAKEGSVLTINQEGKIKAVNNSLNFLRLLFIQNNTEIKKALPL